MKSMRKSTCGLPGRVLCALAAAIVIGGCASGPSGGLPASTRVVQPSIYGRWSASDRSVVTITEGGCDSMVIESTSGSEKRTMTGYVVEIDGQRVTEVCVYRPDAAAKEKNAAPVFDYGQIAIKGDTLTYRPLRVEWLKDAAGTSGGVYVDASRAEKGAGGAVVKDAVAMQDLIRRALHDPRAFGDPMVFTRVK